MMKIVEGFFKEKGVLISLSVKWMQVFPLRFLLVWVCIVVTGTRLFLEQRLRVPFCLVIAEWKTYSLLKAIPELDFHDVLFEVDYKLVADNLSVIYHSLVLLLRSVLILFTFFPRL